MAVVLSPAPGATISGDEVVVDLEIREFTGYVELFRGLADEVLGGIDGEVEMLVRDARACAVTNRPGRPPSPTATPRPRRGFPRRRVAAATWIFRKESRRGVAVDIPRRRVAATRRPRRGYPAETSRGGHVDI